MRFRSALLLSLPLLMAVACGDKDDDTGEADDSGHDHEDHEDHDEDER